MRKPTKRDAQELRDLALATEERANKLRRRDPQMHSQCRLERLHAAARIIGDVGRDMFDELRARQDGAEASRSMRLARPHRRPSHSK